MCCQCHWCTTRIKLRPHCVVVQILMVHICLNWFVLWILTANTSVLSLQYSFIWGIFILIRVVFDQWNIVAKNACLLYFKMRLRQLCYEANNLYFYSSFEMKYFDLHWLDCRITYVKKKIIIIKILYFFLAIGAVLWCVA